MNSELISAFWAFIVSLMPIMIALNAIFTGLAKLPYVGGPWATTASKLCAIAIGDIGGLVRMLGRYFSDSKNSLEVLRDVAEFCPQSDGLDPVFKVGSIWRVCNRAEGRKTLRITQIAMLMLCVLPFVVSCAAAIPVPSTPCKGMYCVEWSGHSLDVPGSLLLCAKTDAELQRLTARLLREHPKSTMRKVGAQ